MKSALLTTVVVSISLLGVSACGSSKSASPAATNSAATVPVGSGSPTANSTLDTTVITAKGTDAEIRAQLVKEVIASGAAQNYTFGEACVKGLIDQLSASDIQAFRVNFRSPTLSAEGQSVGAKIIDCDASKVTTTT